MRISLKSNLVLACVLALAACSQAAPSAVDTPSGVISPTVGSPTAPASVPPAGATVPTTPGGPTTTPSPVSLGAEGPHVLFEGDDGIWIANPDGSFLTRLSDTGVGAADLHRAVSPTGDALAFISPSEQGPVLVQLDIPSGKSRVLATLQTVIPSDITNYPLTDQAFAYYAITNYDDVAWEPGDGRYLAFVGAINGPTSDLYVYDRQTEAITQLTDGGSQAVYPTWSPDGAFVLHFGGRWTPPFGGAIVGYNQADGAWAVRLSDGKVIRQPTALERPFNFVGWTSGDRYLFSSQDEDCTDRDFLTVAAGEAEATTAYETCYSYYAALSPENGAVLFSSDGCDACPLGEGTFLLQPGQGEPILIWPEQSWGIEWLPESRHFYAYPLGLVSSDGQRRYDAPEPDHSFSPAVSKQGWTAWEVIEEQQGRVMVAAPGEDPRLILETSVGAMIWDPAAGDTLLVGSGDGKLYAATAPDFVPRVMGDLGDGVDQAAWVP